MWSVWPETVDVHLGQRLAIVRKGAETQVLAHPATMPLALVLERVAKSAFSGSARRRLRVSLSCAWAPPVVYSVPREVTKWAEKLAIAQSAGATALSTTPDLVAVRIDSRASGIGAAMTTSMLQQLHAWAGAHRSRVVSLRPLWSMATDCKLAKGVAGMELREPDGTVVVVQRGGQDLSPLARVEVGVPVTPDHPAIGPDPLSDAQMLRIGFSPAHQIHLPGAPKRWAMHWHKT